MRLISLMAVAALLSGCATFPSGTRSAECKEVLAMSRAGDHLDAVNLGKTVSARGVPCSPETNEALSFSGKVVTWANDLVRNALKQKETGDLAGARASLTKALEVYPRYYWAGKILRGLDRTIASRTEDLHQEASYLESLEDYEGAVGRMDRILALSPKDPRAMAEKRRIQGVMSEIRKKKDAQAALDDARRLFKDGRLEDAERSLRKGDNLRLLDQEAEVLLVRIESERRRAGQEHLSQARRAEQEGDLDRASEKTHLALEVRSADKTFKTDLIEYARILGMKLYSEGRLAQAKDLWECALGCDPAN